MRIFYIIFFVFISNLSWSQSSLKKAEHHFKNMDFNNVIASYNKAVEDKIELSQTQSRLSVSRNRPPRDEAAGADPAARHRRALSQSIVRRPAPARRPCTGFGD